MVFAFRSGTHCGTSRRPRKAQKGFSPARAVDMDGDTTLEGVGDTPVALKYRDACGQKGEHRWIKRQVPEWQERSPQLPIGWCSAGGQRR